MTDPIKALVGLEAELRILDAHIDKKFAHWTSLYGDRFSEIGNKAAENAYHEAVHAFAVASNRKTILAAIEALKPMADVVMDDPFPIFSDRLRVRREECDEAEVSFDDSDILALAMDVLSGVGWKAPPASPAPVDGELVRAAKIEAFDEALSIAEGSYSYGEQQNEIIAGIRAALAAINGEK